MVTFAEGLARQAAFDTIQKTQPMLIPILRDLLGKGETPKQIYCAIQGQSVELAQIAEQAALYIRDTEHPGKAA